VQNESMNEQSNKLINADTNKSNLK
jgi:hypothetical protein